jgi:hypothetical protein
LIRQNTIQKKGAIKLQTLLDFDGNLPAYVNITDGKTVENKGAYEMPLINVALLLLTDFTIIFHY